MSVTSERYDMGIGKVDGRFFILDDDDLVLCEVTCYSAVERLLYLELFSIF